MRATKEFKSLELVGSGLAVEPFVTALDTSTHTGRRALTSVLDSETFKWALVALGIVLGLFLLAAVIWAIVTKCGRVRSAPVVPGSSAAARGDGGGADSEKGPSPAKPPSDTAAKSATPPGGASAPVTAPSPVPPWQRDPQRLPPGIMLAPVTPPVFSPLVSNPRMASETPYERLVIISSRVHKPDMVARAVLPNVAYVVYDWKNFTLQELLRFIKKVLGLHKVTSIAVVAPGSKPGSVGLLEGAGTSPDKLATKSELSQFWRVLAGCVTLAAGGGGGSDGRRVDLLGCRMVESPREGAALLKELWNLTTVPFAAADDALGGYMLCTFMEEPTTRQLSLISSTIPAIDLYFDRFALLGIPPPTAAAIAQAEAPVAASQLPTAPLPPGPPPASAIGPLGTAPPRPPPTVVAPEAIVAAPTPPLPAAPVVVAADAKPPPLHAIGSDIFSRLHRALQERRLSLEAAFSEYDHDSNGQLSVAELTAMMRVHVPDASPMDVKHFQAMLDTDVTAGAQERMLSRKEFVDGLPENVKIQAEVQAGRDDDEVVPRLLEYLTNNEEILRQVFTQFDDNSDGLLDHMELHQLVDSIPGLDAHERKFIMALLYQHDQNRDQRISLEELVSAIKNFRKQEAQESPPQAVLAPADAAKAQPQQLHGASPSSDSKPGTAAASSLPSAQPSAAVAPVPAGTAAAAATSSPLPSQSPPPTQLANGASLVVPPTSSAPDLPRSSSRGPSGSGALPKEVPAQPLPQPPQPPLSLGSVGPPLGPPGGRLAPLAPLGNGNGESLPRPGALAPLGPLPGR